MKPILFNTDMVRAILDSHKTVTRRVVKPQPEGARSILDCDEEKRTFDLLCGNGGVGGVFVDWAETVKAPFWPHDILYVQETFFEYRGNFYYKADRKHEALSKLGIRFKWHPSIHMPREAARIFLRVTDVWVERLQDITEEQAVAEGFEAYMSEYKENGYWEPATLDFINTWNSTIKSADRALYGWDANPWVWVIEFERITREEALPHA